MKVLYLLTFRQVTVAAKRFRKRRRFLPSHSTNYAPEKYICFLHVTSLQFLSRGAIVLPDFHGSIVWIKARKTKFGNLATVVEYNGKLLAVSNTLSSLFPKRKFT